MVKKNARKENNTIADTFAFATNALNRLHCAGWMPNRTVTTSLYEKAYVAEGVSLLAKAKTFLREFGGLMIRYETKSHQQDVLEFLAERAVVGMGSGGTEGFEELIGIAPLCPIGHYLFGTCILFMDRKGQMFGGSDEVVTFIGKTGQEAICNILCGAGAEVLESRITTAGK